MAFRKLTRFRAWSKSENRFLSNCNVVMSLSGSEIYWAFGYEPLRDMLKEDVEVMQFTGLHDKNGKEIYEGDVVLVAGIKYSVVYEENMCRFAFDDLHGNTSGYLNIVKNNKRHYVVIGNIYETIYKTVEDEN